MNITTLRNTIIPGSRDKPILLDAHFKQNGLPKPIVIFSHGFKGFKDWGHFNLLAEMFAEHDFIFIKFNFSYNGTTAQDPENFGDLEAFGNNNYITELDDLEKVMDWSLVCSELGQERDPALLYLIGHSRGGAISILKAGEDQRVKKLVTWAAVSNLTDRNKKKTIETWMRDGVVYAHNARTGQDMPIYLQFYNNILANRERLEVLQAVKRLEIPFLVAHGTRDEAVPVAEAEILYKPAKHGELLIIEGAGHSFGARHPFEGRKLPAHAMELAEGTIGFLKK
jgi:uncharacterized protein